MTLIAPLNLEQIFIVNVAGTQEIASFLAVLLMAYAFARFDLSGKIAVPLFALCAILLASFLPAIYVLVIITAGLITFGLISGLGRQ